MGQIKLDTVKLTLVNVVKFCCYCRKDNFFKSVVVAHFSFRLFCCLFFLRKTKTTQLLDCRLGESRQAK